MSISLLETIEKLAVEANAADKRKSKQVAILQDEALINKALILDMKDEIERLKTELAEALSSSQLCKISNKSLLQELADMEAGLSAVEETNAIMSDLNKALQDENARLKKIERERDVLAKDNKKLKDNLAKAKSKAEKPKKATNNFELKNKLATANKNIIDMGKYIEASPITAGTMKHSEQGMVDFIHVKPVKMIVQHKGEVTERMVERLIAINDNNSMKVINRIEGDEKLARVTIPKGGVIKIDDEVIEYAEGYFKKSDKHKSDLTDRLKEFK